MMNRGLHVAVFCHRIDGRGIARVCVTLARSMARHGAKTSLVATAMDRAAAPSVSDPVSVHLLSIPLDRTAVAIPRLALWIRRHRPDVLFAHGNGPSRAAVVAARSSGTSTAVVTVEQNHFSTYISPTGGGYAWGSIRSLLTRFLYARADRVAGVSPDVVEDLEARFPGVRGKTVVLPNPGPSDERVERLASEPADHPWFREDDLRPLICSVANVIPRKGQDLLIRALPRIRARVRDARLVLVGRHDNVAYLDRIRSMARERDIEDAVALLGYRANPFPYIEGADVFALASRNEGAPLVLLEAMACGVPVVATDCPSGPRHLLDAGRAGMLVPMDDVEALADALVRTLTETPLREELIVAGRERVADFSPAAVAGAYLEVAETCRRERRADASPRRGDEPSN